MGGCHGNQVLTCESSSRNLLPCQVPQIIGIALVLAFCNLVSVKPLTGEVSSEAVKVDLSIESLGYHFGYRVLCDYDSDLELSVLILETVTLSF